MVNKEILKKKIIYRSLHRGSKEMDILLGRFVKFYINDLNYKELIDLDAILNTDDDILYKWYLGNSNHDLIPGNKISDLLKTFKL